MLKKERKRKIAFPKYSNTMLTMMIISDIRRVYMLLIKLIWGGCKVKSHKDGSYKTNILYIWQLCRPICQTAVKTTCWRRVHEKTWMPTSENTYCSCTWRPGRFLILVWVKFIVTNDVGPRLPPELLFQLLLSPLPHSEGSAGTSPASCHQNVNMTGWKWAHFFEKPGNKWLFLPVSR